MNLEIDPDVKAVAAFMQANIAADRLVSVASAVEGLAPALWGQYDRAEVQALSLCYDPISSGPHKRAASTR